MRADESPLLTFFILMAAIEIVTAQNRDTRVIARRQNSLRAGGRELQFDNVADVKQWLRRISPILR